jgi:DNA-binding MarR family transcriptional regulator
LISPSERAQHPVIELLIQFYLYVKIFNIEAKTDTLSGMKRDMIDDVQEDWSDQRPDLNTEAMGVVLRIQALAKILGEQAAQRLDEYDLQWWQYDVLATLRRQGGPYRMAATELADAVMLTSGAMTNRIDRLEESGLASRVSDEKDRRRVFVQLTADGLELIESAAETRFQSATDAIACLDQSQTAQLSYLLRLVLLAQENLQGG